MTQQQSRASYDPTQDYTSPRDEWAALVTLAAQSAPAETIRAHGWRGDYFASAGARDAYDQLAAASRPVLLDMPADLDGVAPLTDGAALAAVQTRLAQWAQWRDLANVQARLASRIRELRATASAGGDQLADTLATIGDLLTAARGALDATAAKGATGGQVDAVTLGALASVEQYWARVADQRDAMATGLAGLNRMLGGGFQAKRLAVLLGGPGGGKSTLANQIAEHVASAGRPVVYLTLEDAPAVMLARTVARLGGLDYGAVLEGRDSLRAAINATLADIAARQSAARLLYIEDGLTGGPVQPDTLRDLARSHFARWPALAGGGRGLLVVDYLQRWARALRSMPGETRELRELVSWLTERLRLMARELDCSVLTIASQNRASGYGNGGSALASAKESGDIEYTADVVMALGADDKRAAALNCEARALRIDKNRQGPVGVLALDWRGNRQQWSEAAQ